jgi:hypothetical protein
MRKHRLILPETLTHKAIHLDRPNSTLTVVDATASPTPAGTCASRWLRAVCAIPIMASSPAPSPILRGR